MGGFKVVSLVGRFLKFDVRLKKKLMEYEIPYVQIYFWVHGATIQSANDIDEEDWAMVRIFVFYIYTVG